MNEPKLYCGDCLEVMKNIPDNSINMVFCDLPYGTTRNSWDEIISFENLWEQYNRIVKDNGAIVLTSQQPFTSKLIISNIKNFRYEWIWEKNKATGHLNAKKMPLKAHENICIFYKKLPVYNPQKTTGHKPHNAVKPKSDIPPPKKKRNYNHVTQTFGNDGTTTDRYPRTVQKFPVVNNDDPLKWHPTQKPIELIEYFIKTYSNEGDIVLDNCMGSGSTGVACKNINRNFIGIELDEEYFNLASNWMEQTTLGEFFE
jgi:site-specific DNA-methyltransferase (adenine-specific)